MIHVEDKIYSGSGTNRCSAFLTTKLRIRTRIQTLKRKTGKLLFRDSFSVQFMLRAVCGRKFSRQKNLEKNTGACNTHASIFSLFIP